MQHGSGLQHGKCIKNLYSNTNVLLHKIIHDDDTVILDTNMNNMKLKIAATIEFFQCIE